MQKTAVFGCLGGLVVVGIVVALMAIGGYNKLNVLSKDVDGKWAQVQTQYQRRADLIPNLVQTVQGAANFEKSTLTDVVNARANATKVTIDPSHAPNDPAKLEEFRKAQDQLSGTLSRLLVTVEKYPDLKATQGFRDFQAQLEGTENRITVARGDFNTSTQAYNTQRSSFPTVLYAGLMHFPEKPFFKADDAAQSAPKVDFSGMSATPAPTAVK